ncbi:VOC family protein [Photobacterium sp. TY1-4]|uniref:VOC family protein n=1 Tax=Photobacterium sp. TY1-4 TaxID=2899122 RepID=UPI0021BEA3EA|nr:VOC family protein [Photobacterium sp. TY1-4]UXI04560.1 VOC family protein [Photobacterium sp. TY1-4]
MMIHHVSIGTADVRAAVQFYDAVLGALSIKRTHLIDNVAAAYGEQFEFWVGSPCEHQASAGNGAHVAFQAPDQVAVDAFYRVALAQGAQCEGEPGLRPAYGSTYYAAYVRDLDGNKIEAVVM